MEPTRKRRIRRDSSPPSARCAIRRRQVVFDESLRRLSVLFRRRARIRYGVEPDAASSPRRSGKGHPIAAISAKTITMKAANRRHIQSTYWTDGVGPRRGNRDHSQNATVDLPKHCTTFGTIFATGCAACKQNELPAHHRPPALDVYSRSSSNRNALMTLLNARMLTRGDKCAGVSYPTFANPGSSRARFLADADPLHGIGPRPSSGDIAAASAPASSTADSRAC